MGTGPFFAALIQNVNIRVNTRSTLCGYLAQSLRSLPTGTATQRAPG